MELHPPRPRRSHHGPTAARGPTARRADTGGTMPRFLQSPPVRALLTSPPAPAQTTPRLHLRTHTGSAPGLPGRRPVSATSAEGKRLEQGAVQSCGGPSWSRRLFDPPRAAGRLHGAAGRSASPGGLEVKGPHPGLGGWGAGREGRACIPGRSHGARSPGRRCGHPCAQRPSGSLRATQNQNITFC